MSSSLAGLSPITSYLSIIKDESAQVAQYVKATPSVQRTAAAFQSDTLSITSPADILSSKNQAALQVVLGAYNISGQSTESGLLRQLLTQDPSASNSLVRQLANADDLDFVRALTDRTTVSLNFGDPETAGFTAGGGAASQISVNNLSWSQANSSLTAVAPAESWSYVLNDGTGAASIAAALTTALQSTGTAANPVTASYSVNASGTIVGSAGAPSVSVGVDSAGNVTASLTLATDKTGHPIRIANVVGINVPASAGISGAGSPTTLTASTATTLFAGALTATGFNVVQSAGTGASGLSIVNPISNGSLSLSTTSFSSFAATASREIFTSQNVLPLGASGLALRPGQILLSGGNEIGTIKSVDAVGNVTLTANAATAVNAGSPISVAIGAGLSHIGIQIKAQAAAGTNSATIVLGPAGIVVQAGQIITDGSKVVGIVKSVDASGNATLQANLANPVAAGDTLGVISKVTDTQTAALADAGNVSTILSQYETSQYEAQQGKQTPGLDTALYFTRIAPSITSINQLMSDPTLLKVVTTDLGVADTFGQLPFDEQQALLTKKLDVSSFGKPASVQQYAEQYLALTSEQAASGGNAVDPALAILTGGSSSVSPDFGANLFSALYPSSGANSSGLTGVLAALYA